jgi:tetratricopeptide (TPR) repeat protein
MRSVTDLTPIVSCPKCGSERLSTNGVCAVCGTPPGGESLTVLAPSITNSPTASEGPTLLATTGAVHQTATLSGAAATASLNVGQSFGSRYHIIRQLGAGGMGVVYQAWDAELGVAVALKVIRPEVLTDPISAGELERRFKRELVLARTVTHKNVVRIHDLGSIEDVKYLTMPFIEGESLAQILQRRGKIPVAETIAIAKQVAEGLSAAHDVGVIHRDLKPENIMIAADGTAFIMDFGIARTLSGTGTATAMGSVMGTLEYMSPEQAQGLTLDQRTDIYSFGLILYDMLTGRQRIARHANPMSEMMSRMQSAPPAVRQLDGQLPEPLERIIVRCLHPKAEARYAKTAELASDLAALSPDGHRLVRASSKSFVMPAAIAAIVLLFMTAGGWYILKSRGPSPAAAPVRPVSVLVANFDNRAQDPLLDGLVEQAVGVGIEGASFVSMYPRREALRLVSEQKLGPSLNEDTARLVAIREGVDKVVAGSVAAQGTRYDLAVKVVNPDDGKAILTWNTEASGKSDVLNAVGRLAAKVRGALGDRTLDQSGVKNEETFTAASLEAAHYYVQGQELQWAGKYEEAITAYQEAVKLDPTLGRAYAGLGAVSGNLGRRQEAELYYKQAIEHIDRMTDREKYRTRAGYYLLGHDARKGADELEALIKQFPADSSALANLGYASFFRRDMAKALDLGRRASALYPKNVLRKNNVALYAMYAGDFDTARREAEEVLKLNPSFAKAHVAIALSNLAQGKIADADSAYRRLEPLSATGADFAAFGLGDLALYQGKTADAERAVQQALDKKTQNRSATSRARLLVLLAEVRAQQRKPSDAASLAEEAITTAGEPGIMFLAGRVLLESGRAPRALELAKVLWSKLDDEPHVYSKLLEGEADLKRGDPRAALAKFKEAQDVSDTWLGRFGLGRAYLEAGGKLEAESEFERCVKRRGEVAAALLDDVPTYRWFAPVSYYVGRTKEAIKPGSGVESFKAFLAIRSGADSADPMVAEARKLSAPK